MAQLIHRGAVVLVALSIVALYGWEAHARRAVDPTPLNRADQAAYLNYARRMHETHYAVAGDRNRMPVFPFLLSLVYRRGMTDAEFLNRAQSFNINLSILLLGLLSLILRKFFQPFYALALLVVTAFGVFVYRAGTAAVEPLFYFLGFCSFVLLLEMLIAPRWWLAVLAGATTALAYLTKASMLPAIAIWAIVFVAQTFWQYRSGSAQRLQGVGQRFGQLLLALGAFGAVVFPYERTSKELYGHYFFNANSAYYMWCNSWPEALAFTDAWRRGKVAPEDAPSPRKYWRDHSPGQIVERLLHGFKTLLTRSAKPAGYYKFIVLFILAAAMLAIRQPQRAWAIIRENAFAAAFCFFFFVAYVILYAWYDLVVTDSRFVLSLFLPFVFALSLFVLRVGENCSIAIAGRRLAFANMFAAMLIAGALIDVCYNALRIARIAT
ncbi:MAG: hypothetical protein ABR514_09250 [Chthoniobacterales bacterium]